jgi:hypothetical protein
MGLAENGGLPKANVAFRKVGKPMQSLATFWVHPWTVMTFHDPVPHPMEWLLEPGQAPHDGLKRLTSGHRKFPKSYTLNHWVAGSIPTRCMP